MTAKRSKRARLSLRHSLWRGRHATKDVGSFARCAGDAGLKTGAPSAPRRRRHRAGCIFTATPRPQAVKRGPLRRSACRVTHGTGPPDPRHHAADERMEEARDGARNRDQRAREVLAGENHPEAGVLHADLDGNGPRGRNAARHETGEGVAEEETSGVEQEHRDDQQVARLEDDRPARADDGSHDQRDQHHRGERAVGEDRPGETRGVAPQDETGRDGQDHHLHGAEQQPRRRDVDAATRQHGGQRRGHQDGETGRNRRHGYRQRHVGEGQIRDDVRSHPAGTA